MTPSGMAVSSDGYVFVGEFDGYRIQRFGTEDWTLSGFYQPVDMGGVFNTVKGGSTVPLKFEVFDSASGTEQTSTSVVSRFTADPIACPNGSLTTDEIEFTTTGDTSLRYDLTAGQFIQNWKTPAGGGACYVVRMTTTADGGALIATFKMK